MRFTFPIPPDTTPSPFRSAPSSAGFLTPAYISDRPRRSPQRILTPQPITADPARIHPIFINSDLRLSSKGLYSADEIYPVDRLNPVCMGYFNYRQYEAAMWAITAAETAWQSPQIKVSTPPSESLQHRRSSSITSFCRN